MSTWFTGVFGPLSGVLFDVRIEDQDHSARLWREGAVTTGRAPAVARTPRGVMRYLPVARPKYVERYLPDGSIARAAGSAARPR